MSVEHLFLGLIQTAEGKLAQLLKSHDLTEQKLLTVLQTVRGSTKVTSDNPEGTYNVLKKYGQDLVELAKNVKTLIEWQKQIKHLLIIDGRRNIWQEMSQLTK